MATAVAAPLSFRRAYLAQCRADQLEPHPDVAARIHIENALASPSHVPTPDWVSEDNSVEDALAGNPVLLLQQRFSTTVRYDTRPRPFVSIHGCGGGGSCSGGTEWSPIFKALQLAPSELNSLSLHSLALDDAQVVDLAKLLQSTAIVTLRLDYNPLEMNPAAFAELVRYPSQLQRVTLRGNALSVTSVGAVGDALRFNVAIRELSLAYNPAIGDAGVDALMAGLRDNRSLTGLSLVDCGLSGAAVGSITRGTAASYALDGREAKLRSDAEELVLAEIRAAVPRVDTGNTHNSGRATVSNRATMGSGKSTAASGAPSSSAALRKGSSSNNNDALAAQAAAIAEAEAAEQRVKLPPLRVIRCGQVSLDEAAHLLPPAPGPRLTAGKQKSSGSAASKGGAGAAAGAVRTTTAGEAVPSSGGAISSKKAGAQAQQQQQPLSRLPPIASWGNGTTSSAGPILPATASGDTRAANSSAPELDDAADSVITPNSSCASRPASSFPLGGGISDSASSARVCTGEEAAGVPVEATYSDPIALLEGPGATQLVFLDLSSNARILPADVECLMSRGRPGDRKGGCPADVGPNST